MNELNKPPAFLIGQTLTQLESFAISLGCQMFRGRQLFDWLYSKQVDNYEKMSNLEILSSNVCKNKVHFTMSNPQINDM